MKYSLHKLDLTLKRFLLAYISVLTIGVMLGLLYVRTNTSFSLNGTVERFNGSSVDDEFSVPENYPKPISELLMTTHNHIIGFSFIFFSIGMIFYFNSTIIGVFKNILLFEPFLSILLTFGSIWGMRFIDDLFVYLLFISSTIMYLSYFIMAGVSAYELLFKKN